MVEESVVTNRTRDWSPQTDLWAPTQGKKKDRTLRAGVRYIRT